MISILCPTRKRPYNIKRLYDSLKGTSDHPFEIVLYVDNDDDSYDDLTVPVVINKGERIVLSDMWNKCAEKAQYDILMYGADDILFRTLHWDTRVKEQFDKLDDKIAFVFGRDGSPHDTHYGTHGFVHRNWIKALGYICPPIFSGDYSDTWINDIARKVNRAIYIDILTEHMHPDLGKTQVDETYNEKYERMIKDSVKEKYLAMEPERVADAEKLRKAMQ